jgi:hypothetical protein
VHGYITSFPSDAMAHVIIAIGRYQRDLAEFINDGRELKSKITGRVHGVTDMKVYVDSQWTELPWVDINARFFSGADQTLHVNTQTATVEAFLLVANDEIQFKMHKPSVPSWWDDLYPDKTTKDDVDRAVENPQNVEPGLQTAVYQYSDTQIAGILSNFLQRVNGVSFKKQKIFDSYGFKVQCLPQTIKSCVIYGACLEKDDHTNNTHWAPAKACLTYWDKTGTNIMFRNKTELTKLLTQLIDGLFSFRTLKSEMPTPSWPHIMQSIEQRLDRLLLG